MSTQYGQGPAYNLLASLQEEKALANFPPRINFRRRTEQKQEPPEYKNDGQKLSDMMNMPADI